MSWFRLGSALDRLSPFTRSPTSGPATVTDSDFSYITNDDLKRQAAQSGDDNRSSRGSMDRGPQRETDVLTIKERGKDHVIHFPAYSIVDGDLSIKNVKDAAAKKLGVDSASLKLTHRGKVLRNESKSCRSEGLADGGQILCSVQTDSLSPYDDDELSDDDTGSAGPSGTQKKKKRNRSGRNKKKKRSEAEGDAMPQSQFQVPSGANTPLTAKAKLIALRATLDSYDQDVQSFLKAPPADAVKRNFEHKRLSETILTQVLLKIDAVETEGDPDARVQRKELVKDTQSVLTMLDNSNNSRS